MGMKLRSANLLYFLCLYLAATFNWEGWIACFFSSIHSHFGKWALNTACVGLLSMGFRQVLFRLLFFCLYFAIRFLLLFFQFSRVAFFFVCLSHPHGLAFSPPFSLGTGLAIMRHWIKGGLLVWFATWTWIGSDPLRKGSFVPCI